MLKRNTLFIVGAGGSVDFGFPIGSGLVSDIHHQLVNRHNNLGYAKGDHDLIDAMLFTSKCNSIDMKFYYEAGQKLGDILAGRPVSIDNVIHTHRSDANLVSVAKLAIARIILEDERKSYLNLRESAPLKTRPIAAENWLSSLLSSHFAGFEISGLNNVFQRLRFISFNYDRCIVQIVRRALAANFQIDDATLFSTMKSLQVHHPYGSLGTLPDFGVGGEFGFGQVLGAKRLYQMAQQIRTFTEGMSDEKLHNRILESIVWADNIAFIGFGYHDLNMKLLDHPGIADGSKQVFASAYKMSATAAVEVRNLLYSQFGRMLPLGLDLEQDASKFVWEFEKKLFN